MAFSTHAIPEGIPAGMPQQQENPFYADPAAQNIMLQAGLNYGQTLLQHGIHQGQQGMMQQYMPFMTSLRSYFCVDNTYVRRKLGILFFPFTRKFSKPSTLDTAGQDDNTNYQSSVFGSPTVHIGSPNSAMPYAFAPPTGGIATSNKSATVPLPINDPFAFDLYIPLMSSITYVIVSAYVMGLRARSSVSTEYLVTTATAVTTWVLIEAAAMKLAAYLLRAMPGIAFLTAVSLGGYKYALICAAVLLRRLLYTDTWLAYFASLVMYVVLAGSFFAIKSVTALHVRDDGRVPPRARLFSYLVAALQLPITLWMCARPFYY